MTGVDLITTSIICMEEFLSNNVPFSDTDDALTFISNTINDECKFNIMDYLDEPVSKDTLMKYLLNHVKEGVELDEKIISDVVDGLSPEMINRLYYKNQILELVKNSWFKDKLNKMSEFVYAEQPAKEMEEDLNEFKDKIIQFCYYDHLFEDRYKRSMKDKRKSIITIDTDSNFINLDKYVHDVTDLLKLDPENETQQMTVMNIFINVTTEVLKKIFWNLTTNMGLIDRCKPIINMKSEFIYKRILLTKNKKNYGGIITGELGKLLTKPALDIKGLAIRKTTVSKMLRNEFTSILENDILSAKQIDLKSIIDKYDRLGERVEASLRNGSTEYAIPGNCEIFENYSNPEQMRAVRGITVWNALEMENQIIPPDKVNILDLNEKLFEPFRKLDHLENMSMLLNDPDVSQELKDLIIKYPEKAKIIAKVAYNVDNSDNMSMLLNDPDVSQELKDLIIKYPEKAKIIAKVAYNVDNSDANALDISKFGMGCLAIPKGDEKSPEYILPFIDYTGMVNKSMTNGYILLESIGIYISDVSLTKYKSNIIQI